MLSLQDLSRMMSTAFPPLHLLLPPLTWVLLLSLECQEQSVKIPALPPDQPPKTLLVEALHPIEHCHGTEVILM